MYISRSQYMIQDKLAWSEFGMYELSAGLVCNKFKNIALNYAWRPKIITQNSLQQSSKILQQSHIFDISYFPGSQTWISIENEYYSTKQASQKKFEALFCHFTMGYKLKKSQISFILRCTNLMNSSSVVNYYGGDYTLTESYYKIRPREITLSISFRLVDLKK